MKIKLKKQKGHLVEEGIVGLYGVMKTYSFGRITLMRRFIYRENGRVKACCFNGNDEFLEG